MKVGAWFRQRPEILATLGMYLLEIGIIVLAFAVHQGTAEGATGFQTRKLQLLTLGGGFTSFLAVAFLMLGFRASAHDRRGRFWAPMVLNVLVVGVFFAFVEAALRIMAQADPLGERIGSTVLLPYDWKRLAAANVELLERSRTSSAYFVEDDTLGWNIAPSRTSADGLYRSSAEGLRSAVVGETYAVSPAPPRVVLTGNSFIFSEEVPFEDSLGRFLDDELPEQVQVLNFAVPGYGVDQAALRVEQEAQRWRPQVAVLGFIQDDLYRNVNVYAFLKIGWETPLSKPRFVPQGDGLELLNVPNLDPDAMFAKESIFDLPLLDHDIEFSAYQWQRRPLHASYLFRYLAAAFPAWPMQNAHTSEEAIVALGPLVIERFVTAARRAGAWPLVVYLPSRGDFQGASRAIKDRVMDAAVRRSGAAQVVDLTECLLDNVSREDLFLKTGIHYSREGNRAVAECLASMIEPRLTAAEESDAGTPGRDTNNRVGRRTIL